MRQRTDGAWECGWSELTPDQQAAARDMLPIDPPVVRDPLAIPTAKGKRARDIARKIEALPQQQRKTAAPVRLRHQAGRLFWRLSPDRARVVGYDPDIMF